MDCSGGRAALREEARSRVFIGVKAGLGGFLEELR